MSDYYEPEYKNMDAIEFWTMLVELAKKHHVTLKEDSDSIYVFKKKFPRRIPVNYQINEQSGKVLISLGRFCVTVF